MKNTYFLSKGKLVLTSGIGIPNYATREEGKFQVRYQNTAKNFFTLIKACRFYLELEEEASLWDMTGKPSLVESKYFVH